MRGTQFHTTQSRRLFRSIPAHAGNTDWQSAGVVAWRSIPAHAGNTAKSVWRSTVRAVHPRACGEHGNPICAVRHAIGPSPRMRGTHRRPVPDRAPGPVHPRACGEHAFWLSVGVCFSGPSPRMRGTPAHFNSPFFRGRSIPAHAGNTRQRAAYYALGTVHPRACGEHSAFQESGSPCCGPSPRMRGTRARIGGRHCPVRSIPAHAGNTPG